MVDRGRGGKTTLGNGLEFGKSQRAVENRKQMEKTCYKIICGAPTTLVVKGLMMMICDLQDHAQGM